MSDVASTLQKPGTAPALPAASPGGLPWALWRRQFAAAMRLEMQRNFLGRRALTLLILAALPLLPIAGRWVHSTMKGFQGETDLSDMTTAFAVGYQAFVLHFVIYMGCVLIFGNLLVRREILDRTLHYAFLSPVRRELLAVAKLTTGLLVAIVLFGGSTALAFLLNYLPYPGGSKFVLHGAGLGHLGAYFLVTVLACIGYGAMFLTFGAFFRSPALPALVFFGWEWLHFLLPPLLKQLSIIHYLQSLCPVPVSEGPLAVLSDAPSPWVAIPGLLLLAAILLTLSAWRVRSMEVAYEED